MSIGHEWIQHKLAHFKLILFVPDECETSRKISLEHIPKRTRKWSSVRSDLLINAWKIDYDVYVRCVQTHPVCIHCCRKRNRVVAGARCKIKTASCQARFSEKWGTNVMGWGWMRNKRKINNIWANMNTAWTWGGSMVYMALAYGMARADVWGRCRELGHSLVHEKIKKKKQIQISCGHISIQSLLVWVVA